MTVGEIRKSLEMYPEDALFRVGVAIPDLFVNTMANAAITGNHVQPCEVTEVRLVATVPSRRVHVPEGPVSQS